MLPKSKKKELYILYYILSSEASSLKTIEEDLGIPIRNAKAIIYRLNRTIEEKLAHQNFLYATSHGNIQVDPLYDQQKFEVFFKLRLTFYQESSMYKMLLLLINFPTITREELTEKLFISTSSFNRIYQELNRFLKPFDIRIVGKNNRFQFEGKELNIRLTLFHLTYFVYQDIEWPFSSISLETIDGLLRRKFDQIGRVQSEAKRRCVYFLYAIIQTRAEEGNLITDDYPPEVHEILALFQPSKEVQIFNKRIIEKQSHKTRDLELKFGEFFGRVYFPELDKPSEQIERGKRMAQGENNVLFFSRNVIEEIDTFLYLKKDEDFYFRIYEFNLFLCLLMILGPAYAQLNALGMPHYERNIIFNETRMTAIKKGIRRHLKIAVSEEILEEIATFLYTIYEANRVKPVRIFLEFTKNLSAEYIVRRRILQIYHTQSIHFTDKIDHADLIIFDVNSVAKPINSHYFYLSSINSNSLWRELFTVIQKIINDKTFT
ncbi:helix-turn-helix domain-containing protein [Enterococcus sp. DIV0756]|uniref:helix-turn-helix domain-containing protein n=1 Tax=Enterococcus sp. DIV0756 TaxID=2774636 RepID=UPI003F29218C